MTPRYPSYLDLEPVRIVWHASLPLVGVVGSHLVTRVSLLALGPGGLPRAWVPSYWTHLGTRSQSDGTSALSATCWSGTHGVCLTQAPHADYHGSLGVLHFGSAWPVPASRKWSASSFLIQRARIPQVIGSAKVLTLSRVLWPFTRISDAFRGRPCHQAAPPPWERSVHLSCGLVGCDRGRMSEFMDHETVLCV